MLESIQIVNTKMGEFMENVTLEKKDVFISYCHRDVNEEWIDKLATALGHYGINTIVDIYDLQLGQDLPYFMEQIKKVDKVLILMGKVYMEKANDREGGVGTETQIISNDVYKDVEQTKFIPIVVNKDEMGNVYLPYYLEAKLYTDFSDDNSFAKNMEELVRQIHKLPKRVKPTVSEPPQFLVKQNTNLGILSLKDDLSFEDLAFAVLKEMEKIKCTHDEYENGKDESIIKRIDESKEIRDYFLKKLCRMLEDKSVNAEDLVSFLEKAYGITTAFKEGTYYDSQNDSCHFFLQEIVIYIVAILYKKRMFKMIYQVMKTTYFPDSIRPYIRDGIRLENFYHHLESLEYRNTRLNLRRRSLHADLLMQRASIKDIDINFDDVRLSDNLILMLSEWFFKQEGNYIYWYPVTIVYASYGYDECLQLRKYLVSDSRFNVVQELFGVNNQAEFIKRYNDLSVLLKNDNRRVDFCTIPSICSIVKADELFSKE